MYNLKDCLKSKLEFGSIYQFCISIKKFGSTLSIKTCTDVQITIYGRKTNFLGIFMNSFNRTHHACIC